MPFEKQYTAQLCNFLRELTNLLSRKSGLSVTRQTSVSLLSRNSGQAGRSLRTHQTRLARQTSHSLLSVASSRSRFSLQRNE